MYIIYVQYGLKGIQASRYPKLCTNADDFCAFTSSKLSFKKKNQTLSHA